MGNNRAKKLLLIGWDAADWKIITPLLDAGKLPALHGLVENGAMGNIATLDPPLSPMLWTSIATGMHAHKHGILGFTETAPDGNGVRPATVTSRKVKAIWNILNQNGLRSNVVGWWPSHPAEPIDGAMVSNHYYRVRDRLGNPWPMLPHTVHPPRLENIMRELRVHPEELTCAHLLPFVPQMDRVDQDRDRRLFSLAKIVAGCASVHAAATYLMENEPWDFMAVYYDAIDHFCHGFINYHPPKMDCVSQEDFEIYREVVAGGYLFHDMMLDRLLALAGPDTAVILVSDHGFHSDAMRPDIIPDEPAGPAHQHRPYGVLCMKGPGVKKDERIYGATLLDIAPTILNFFGLPVGKDMDGKILADAFSSPVRPEFVDSWESVDGDAGLHPPDMRNDPLADQEALEQLVALGYIDPPEGDVRKNVEKTSDESHYNLARVYLNVRRYDQALPLLEYLYEKDPDQVRYGFYLAKCLEALRRFDDCRRVVNDVISRCGAEVPRLNVLRGSLSLLEKRYDKALEYLLQAENAGSDPILHNQIGRVYGKMKLWQNAERAFLAAIDIDPDNADSHDGLAWVYLNREQWEDAAEMALSAAGLRFQFPRAHYHLGLALTEMAYYERAAEAFEICLSMASGVADARRKLIGLYEKHLNRIERAEMHRQWLEKAKAPASGMQKGRVRKTDKRLPPTRRGDHFGPEAVTVVSGLPRSGTSLMMQMLARGGMSVLADEVRKADEDNPRGYYEYEKAKSLLADDSWMGNARGKAVKIVVPLLMRLPRQYNYRIIVMERDMWQILASQKKMRERKKDAAGFVDMEQLRKTYQRWMEEVRGHVAAWNNARVLFMSYADAVSDPMSAAEAVNDFLCGFLRPSQMAMAAVPELYRQRQSESTPNQRLDYPEASGQWYPRRRV